MFERLENVSNACKDDESLQQERENRIDVTNISSQELPRNSQSEKSEKNSSVNDKNITKMKPAFEDSRSEKLEVFSCKMLQILELVNAFSFDL